LKEKVHKVMSIYSASEVDLSICSCETLDCINEEVHCCI